MNITELAEQKYSLKDRGCEMILRRGDESLSCPFRALTPDVGRSTYCGSWCALFRIDKIDLPFGKGDPEYAVHQCCQTNPDRIEISLEAL